MNDSGIVTNQLAAMRITPEQYKQWKLLLQPLNFSEEQALEEIAGWAYLLKRSCADVEPWVELRKSLDRDLIEAWIDAGLTPEDFLAWRNFGVLDAILARCFIDDGIEPHAPKTTPTRYPLLTAASFARSWPGIWQAMDSQRAVPASQLVGSIQEAALNIYSATVGVPVEKLVEQDLPEMAIFAMRALLLGNWRLTQGIYRFDPDVYAALHETNLEGDIPAEALRYLPETSLWIETPVLETSKDPIIGFFVSVYEIDGELNLYGFAHRHADTRAFATPLRNRTVDQIRIEEQNGSTFLDAAILVNLLLYLAQPEPDLDGTPRVPTPKKVKAGLKYFAPKAPQIWGVGVRTGPMLRRAAELEAHDDSYDGLNSLRPHIRRAHWRKQRYGKRDAPTIRAKWINMMLVRADRIDEAGLPAVVRNVE